MKYIGIRGHRGSGKKTIAYLLAKTIDYIIESNRGEYEDFLRDYNSWCDEVIVNENIINSIDCKHVIVESFGDTPKILLQLLTGIPMADMNRDYTKDHIIFNLKTFENKIVEDTSTYNLVSARDYFIEGSSSIDPETIKEDVYMTLRELILYFGIYIMQNAFGLNVWIKSLVANSTYFSGLFPDDKSGYKIYRDIKARTELSYIKDHNGLVIKISRPSYKKNGGMNLLRGDSRYDYEIINEGGLHNLHQQIYNVATKIIQHETL